ncbi:MAG: response regulator [Burkholderiales bacterium]|nr:response regulator [Burkholderiales bacterium]MDE2076084.1 response regulator [Burkholderiales bacterium]MDE2431464.1 response regulator [Burkholderiales bacterium]
MQQKTVLVVDDSASFRQVVTASLEKAGYEVVQAADGLDACGKLDGRRIGLIICDINMPRMDGLTFVEHVKSTVQYKFTPILMLTTEGHPSIKEKGRALGVRGWIIKPFQPTVLLQAVEKLYPA